MLLPWLLLVGAAAHAADDPPAEPPAETPADDPVDDAPPEIDSLLEDLEAAPAPEEPAGAPGDEFLTEDERAPVKPTAADPEPQPSDDEPTPGDAPSSGSKTSPGDEDDMSDMVRSLVDDLGLPDDGEEEEISEAEIINSFIRFGPLQLDDRRVRPIFGLYGGMSVPQHRLGPAPAGRLEVGARLPWARGRFTALATVDGIFSRNQQASELPQPWSFTVQQQDLAVAPGVAWRVFGYREGISPEIGLAPQVTFMHTQVEGGPDGATPYVGNSNDTRVGGLATIGVSNAVGPGYLGVVGSVAYTTIDDPLTGSMPQLRFGLSLGYRFVLVTSPPQGPRPAKAAPPAPIAPPTATDPG